MSEAVANVRKISVALTKNQIAALQAAVDNGACRSTYEMAQEAIAASRLDHPLHDDDFQRLRELWDAGKSSGAAGPFEIERTLAAARSRIGLRRP
jgi:antitoxin ParD1/3/4